MAAQKWTEEQRAEALQLHHHHGPAEAERRTGIPRATIKSWARRAGVLTSVVPPPGLEAAIATSAMVAEQRRLDLADGLLDDVSKLRARLFEPMTYSHVKVVGGGDTGTYATQVDVEAPQPVPGDQLKLVQSITALIDKVQLLTGEATSREDHTGGLDLDAELRKWQGVMAEQAAMQRAQETL